ncbi:hypothetical protein NQ317_001372 [Molorchus minor]|uniref:C2H2-type domain-containing protein n=1 Tax=Molorchus minor TaxID=1323400 RepID=A0ABQ9J736_9CUCU|nr:hypothetical protein NQ317_001372 [Molorchus minor]
MRNAHFGKKMKNQIKQNFVRLDSSEQYKPVKSEMCQYQTGHAENLKKRLVGREDISKCSSLTHRALEVRGTFPKCSCINVKCVNIRQNAGKTLKNIFLVHKDISEVQMYKCETCEFQTKHKENLKQHVLVHRDISEVQTYKCEVCNYQTKYKGCLKRHLLESKDISELQLFKCEMCEYQTARREYFKKHLLGHKDISEIQRLFKCETCEYQTRYSNGS